MATPPHINCGKYFRPVKLLVDLYAIRDREATSTKPGRLAGAAGFPGERARNKNTQIPAMAIPVARFRQPSDSNVSYAPGDLRQAA